MSNISANFNGTNGSRYYGNLTYVESVVDTANNRSYIELYLDIASNNGAYSFWGYNNEGRIYIDGVEYVYGNYTGTVNTTPQRICQVGVWINHDTNGSKSITIGYAINSGYCGTSSASTGWTLTQINRYASYLNGTPYAEAITDVGFNVAVLPDVTCDSLATSLDGGAWVYWNGDFSGWKVVTLGGNLTSGVNHTFKTSIKRKDSQLWTESATKNVTTLSQNNFLIVLD